MDFVLDFFNMLNFGLLIYVFMICFMWVILCFILMRLWFDIKFFLKFGVFFEEIVIGVYIEWLLLWLIRCLFIGVVVELFIKLVNSYSVYYVIIKVI